MTRIEWTNERNNTLFVTSDVPAPFVAGIGIHGNTLLYLRLEDVPQVINALRRIMGFDESFDARAASQEHDKLIVALDERVRDIENDDMQQVYVRLDALEQRVVILATLSAEMTQVFKRLDALEAAVLTGDVTEQPEPLQRIEDKVDYIGTRTANKFAEQFGIDPNRTPRRMGKGTDMT